MRQRRGVLTILVVAACAALLGALVWEATAQLRAQPGPWAAPVLATSTAGAADASGWWQSMPTPPAWPTPLSTLTPTLLTTPPGEASK